MDDVAGLVFIYATLKTSKYFKTYLTQNTNHLHSADM